MRRKRFQRGSLKAHKRRGKMRWYAQWREEGIPRSKELGLCSEVSRISAEAMLQDILKLINEGAERREKTDHTFETFIELVYLPVYEQKWKDSTKDTETNRIRCHLVRKLRDRPMRKIDREEMQRVLNGTAKTCGQSMVDHLRFRLRSIFELAVSEGVADRNPAVALFTPKTCRPGRERALISCPPSFNNQLRTIPLRRRSCRSSPAITLDGVAVPLTGELKGSKDGELKWPCSGAHN